MNQSTLAFHIGQKDKLILDLILKSLNLGHIRFDKYNKTYIYSITNKEGIRYILNYLKLFPLHTKKNIDVFTFNRLLYFIDNKYHFKNHFFYSRFFNLVFLFNKRLP
jgi:hypothetical protein